LTSQYSLYSIHRVKKTTHFISSITSHLTHNKSFKGRVFPASYVLSCGTDKPNLLIYNILGQTQETPKAKLTLVLLPITKEMIIDGKCQTWV